MKRFVIILIFLPAILFGQERNSFLDSIINGGLGDTLARPVYFVVDEMPKLENGKKIESYLMSQSLTTDNYPCCAFKAYIGFVIESDSSLTNKLVYVKAVNCEYGLVYEGNEIEDMKSKIMQILDLFPAVIPGKLKGENVAVKYTMPVHVDCYMR